MNLRIKKSQQVQVLMTWIGVLSVSIASNPTSGQLIVVNGLANVVNGSGGSTVSSVAVVVRDSTGACKTQASVSYLSTMTASWSSSNTHSATSCTDITTVDVTALKPTGFLTVQYDSTQNASPPATATAPTTFTAPLAPIRNLVLIVTGGDTASQTASTTTWGYGQGYAPQYVTVNGAVQVTGVMAGVGSEGVKAEKFMRLYGISPAK